MTDYTDWLERQTDAGTRPLIPLPEPLDERADDAYDRQREREDTYRALRALAVAALAVALSACGAGLPDEIDSRPLDVASACAQQPNGVCDGPKVVQ